MPAIVFFLCATRDRVRRCLLRLVRGATPDVAERLALEASADPWVPQGKAAAATGAANCATVRRDEKTGSGLSEVLVPLGTCKINPLPRDEIGHPGTAVCLGIPTAPITIRLRAGARTGRNNDKPLVTLDSIPNHAG